MAAEKKKSGGKQASGGHAKTAGRTKATPPARRPYRREVGAVICLFLAIFSSFGYFHMEAIAINFICGAIKGLIGYGAYIMPPALLLGAYILGFHRGRPVALRLSCALLFPLVVSSMIHGMFAEPLPWDGTLLMKLWEGGEELHSGGVLGGVLGQSCAALFTSLGSTIVFAMAAIIMGLAAFNRTLADVADWIFNRPRYTYEPEEPKPVSRSRRSTSNESIAAFAEKEALSQKSNPAEIDIPVDEGPLCGKSQTGKPKRVSFFNRKPRVPTPDQFLRQQSAEKTQTQKPAPQLDSEAVDVPLEEHSVVSPVSTSEETVISESTDGLQKPMVEPAADVADQVQQPQVKSEAKISHTETAHEAEIVAKDIEKSMQQGEKSYQYPPLSLLIEGSGGIGGEALAELNANKLRLSDTIHSFGIDASITNVTRGPSVTRYELELDQGVRLNKLTNLSDDIALALGATGVRIAPIPDQISMVGIEVPNKLVSPVNIHSVIGSKAFTDSKSKVSFAVGKDIGGNPIVGNIAKMPHLLIAGTTGSGKSVCTNSLIISLLYKATPDEVRLIMVDPKMVELGIYNGIPHLLIPVVTDPKKAAGALQWTVSEMMKRYRLFSECGARDLKAYNAKVSHTEDMKKLPQVVVIIDELADLMLVAAKEVEESICRVAQMGRAAGIHLIIATQRPSADVITGLMKANIPSRIAFAVASSLESRIILDITGAEKLVGRGDMLYFPLGAGKPIRVQGCLITDQEVAAVVDFVKKSGTAQYDNSVIEEIEQHVAEKEKGSHGVGGTAPDSVNNEYDELIDSAAEVIVETGQASVSMLQRRLKLGYARAARLVDQLEELGIVGPFEGSKPRQLLITKEQWQEMKYRKGALSQSPLNDSEPILTETSLSENPVDKPPFDVEKAMDQAEEKTL